MFDQIESTEISIDAAIEAALLAAMSEPAEYGDNTFCDTLADESAGDAEFQRATSFAHEGLMTLDHGVVLTLADGSEYQLTIVKSRNAER